MSVRAEVVPSPPKPADGNAALRAVLLTARLSRGQRSDPQILRAAMRAFEVAEFMITYYEAMEN